MHNLMSYFFGTKVQMTTALLWFRNCCSFSHPYRTPREPWDRSTSVLRCSCKWHSSSQLQASNCTSNQWQKFLSLMRFLITIHFFYENSFIVNCNKNITSRNLRHIHCEIVQPCSGSFDTTSRMKLPMILRTSLLCVTEYASKCDANIKWLMKEGCTRE